MVRVCLILSFASLATFSCVSCKAQAESKSPQELEFDSLQNIVKTDQSVFSDLANEESSDSLDNYWKDVLNLSFPELVDKHELSKEDQDILLSSMRVSADIISRDKEIKEILNLSFSGMDSLLNHIDTNHHQYNEQIDEDSTSSNGWKEVSSPW